METGNRFDGIDDYAIKLIRYRARQLVGLAGLTESDRPDLEQDMMLDLLRRLPRYDPERAQRSTFIARVVDHRVATILEARRAEKRDPRCEAGSLDERIRGIDGSVARVDTLDHDETYWRRSGSSPRTEAELLDLGLDLELAVSALSPALRELCELLRTSTVTEIARGFGCSRAAVYDAIKRARRQLEKAGLGEYV